MAPASSPQPRGSRIISRLLPPAIRFWLSTQLDHVENLQFEIQGRDREILSGHIPEIALSAQKAIYQGIHLSQAAVTASAIRVNLGQVVRRQPLRLLAPFPIQGAIELTEADFNNSLQSPLLGEGLYDFLQLLARSQPEAASLQDLLDALPDRTVHSHYQAQAAIQTDYVILRLRPKVPAVPAIAIRTQLSIRDGHRLCLDNPHWLKDDTLTAPTSIPLSDLHGFAIDLGKEVMLTDCRVADQKLRLSGTVRVLPTAPETTGE
ncbi:DUF2993 domain-containing protein [Halomicronema sp. CCY15110]|uniref:LmeA family phospholipid-binding protein n=1 Tax=Halomicronema sp. CCY15110 TaxID=2767773 RepID=UPI00194FCAB7|nr:DUF2993 domain-containing protein [Halomicronema sp. CCY15110]